MELGSWKFLNNWLKSKKKRAFLKQNFTTKAGIGDFPRYLQQKFEIMQSLQYIEL